MEFRKQGYPKTAQALASVPNMNIRLQGRQRCLAYFKGLGFSGFELYIQEIVLAAQSTMAGGDITVRWILLAEVLASLRTWSSDRMLTVDPEGSLSFRLRGF
jgi:hypothetical protein